MGSLEDILERVQYKFASIIGELCGDPQALSQFAIWVDLRLAEYKLKGCISLDCSGQKIDPDWLKSLHTIHTDTSHPSPVSQTPSSAQPQPPHLHFQPVTKKSTTPNKCLPQSHPQGPSDPFTPRGTPASNLSSPLPAHLSHNSFSHLPTHLEPPTPTTTRTPATNDTSTPLPREEADSRKRTATPDVVVVVKQEPIEQEDVHVNDLHVHNTPVKPTPNATRPHFVEASKKKINSSCILAADLSTSNSSDQEPMSPSKIPRLSDGPPPLKPIVDEPEGDSNLTIIHTCSLGSNFRETPTDNAFHSDQSMECLESDVDIMASTSCDVSDVPEDLSMSRFNPVSWNGHPIADLNSHRAVIQPFAEFSCLRNGAKFTQKWHQFVTNRSINLKSMSSDRYKGYMDLLKVAQSKVHVPKSVKEHKMLYKFDLWRDGTSERLIKKRHKDNDPVRFYIPDDQLYHALLAVHLDSGHGGIKKMLTLCKERYANITADAVKLFTHLCYDCQTRKRTLPPKPRDNSL